jgi:Glycosyl transferase family 2
VARVFSPAFWNRRDIIGRLHALKIVPEVRSSNGQDQPAVVVFVLNVFEDVKRACGARGSIGRSTLSLEILIVNDGSTDGTAEIVKAFRTRGRAASSIMLKTAARDTASGVAY